MSLREIVVSGKPLNVLVTAVGGDLGQAIVKALRLSRRPIRLHGCDVDPVGIGGAFVGAYRAVPLARDEAGYLQALATLCQDWEIDVVIPASEAEMRVLGRELSFPRFARASTVVSQTLDWFQTFGDKLSCMRALASSMEVVPFADALNRAELTSLVSSVGFPLIVKPRISSGARGVALVRDDRELEAAIKGTPSPMAQQFIDDDGGEFSVGVFCCSEFQRAIAFKRDLDGHGPTWYAETSNDPQVLDYALRVAEVSGLRGSANIQVRKSRLGVRLLEVNPRFSSLVAARAACGFTDVEWAISLALREAQALPNEVFRAVRFRRYFHELVDLGSGFTSVAEWLPFRSLRVCDLR